MELSCNVKRALAVCLCASLSSSCGGDLEPRLQKPLAQQGIRDVAVGEANITATCAQGDKVEVPKSELEQNFMGMVKTDKIAAVVQKIYSSCDAKDKARQKEEARKSAFADEAKKLGISIEGKDDEGARAAICDKLATLLPVKDAERAVQAAKNSAAWGCPEPPPLEALPTGKWQIDIGKPVGKKPATSALRLENDRGDRLALRCSGAKVDLYVQPSEPPKKGTAAVDAKLDGAKPAKWKVKGSTDGKALFIADLKAAAPALGKAERLTLAVPTAKGTNAVTFDVRGFADARAQLPKTCKM
jgi:hypothetical protein